MTDRGSQTIRRRRLAAELRRLRERAGLTGDEAADRLGWSASKISRIETHRIGVKPADLRRILDLYHVDAEHGAALQALAQESARAAAAETVAAGLPADYTAYVSAETEAQSIWNWDPLVVPGLLQTEAYATVVHLGYQSMFRIPPGDAERRMQVRRTRQLLLTRDDPPELVVVIDESVLHRRFGSRLVMHAQLLHLVVQSGLPNVRIHVLPLRTDHALTTGAFSYMQFPQVHEVPLHDIVSVEHLTGSYYLEDDEETFRYRVAFDWLVEHSLPIEESRSVVAATAAERWAVPDAD